MKRSRPTRSTTPIPRSAPKRSTNPIRARKADPSKRRFAKHRCKPYLDWLKTQSCCVTGKRTDEWFAWLPRPGFRTVYHPFQVAVDPAHVKARGAAGDDLWNALPLAHHLHEEQHTRGAKTFWAKYGLDPVEIAADYTERFLALHPEFGDARP